MPKLDTKKRTTSAPEPGLAHLEGGGEMGGLIRDFDWAGTPLGPMETWPAGRTAVVSLILRTPTPIATLWGEDGVMIYNDAYAIVAGNRHPAILGSKVCEGWPEVASFNENVLRTVLTGNTLAYRDEPLTLHRNGVPERVWLNLDYSPILDENGTPVAVMAIVVETTGKVRAERRLTGERERLRQMFDQAPGLIAMLEGPDHIFTLANAAVRDFLGNRDIIGRPVREAVPEAVAQGFGDLLDQVYAHGTARVGRGVPFRLENAEGVAAAERYVDFIFQPITAEDGEVTGIFVQGHDVTEEKRSDEALRESEARFRLLADSAPVMLWMGDASGKCLYLNALQREFWGVDPEAIDGFDWSPTVHPDDSDALRIPFEAAMRAQTGFTVECRLRRADGAYRRIRTTAQPRFSADGAFLGMIGVNVDVTDLRESEAAIRSESQRLAILNRTGAAIAAEHDLGDIVQLVTDACVSLTGAEFGAFFYNVTDENGARYTLYCLSGVPRETFADFPMPRATQLFEPTFRGERPVRSDDVLADPRYGHSAPHYGMPRGHLPVRSYLAVPVISRSGEIFGGLFFGHPEVGVFAERHEEIVLGVAGQAATAIDNARLLQAAGREVAERRRAESSLQALNDTLEERVAEAIAERSLAEEALRQAQKLEAIGKLTGGVAHDFNNLLQVISGNLQLLARDVAGSERAETRVASALASVSQGAQLASQLLAFSRREPLEPRVVNVGRMVSGMTEMLRRTIGDGIEVETIAAGGLWNSMVDPVRLETAVLNLALNARDAMEGSGKLTIEVGNAFLDETYSRANRDVAPGQYVMLAVTDTGSGIDREIQDLVFEPFFTTKPQGKGTGLGLSMVYGFVKQSGGHVKIYSEISQGTTVRLYLPRIDQNEDLVVNVDAGPVAGGTETILVAEDDEEVRAIVVEMLSDLGYRVLTAKDAASAISVIESGVPIDLLFTDVVMPGKLRSPEMARMARARLPGLAVLFTSGYTENSIVHEGRLDAGIELLSKPYTREALARKLRAVLARAKASDEGPAAVTPRRALRVLLCEDDPIIRLNTAEFLAEAGMIVTEAGSGAAAMAALEREAPDVCVIDVGLPDMSGVDLARLVRAVLPLAPVVFATGNRDVAEAHDMDRVEIVGKPYDHDDLCASIFRLTGAEARRAS